MRVFAGAFLLLVGSAVAVALGQFTASHRAPWVSIGLSAAAVVGTVVALAMHPRR
jgi:membrane protein YdbS with pleckstrin-like domain